MMTRLSGNMSHDELVNLAKAEGLKVANFKVRKWTDVPKDSLMEALKAIMKRQAIAEQARRKAEEAEQAEAIKAEQEAEQARKQAEAEKQEAEKANRRKAEQERRKQAEEAEKKEQARKQAEQAEKKAEKEQKQAEKEEQNKPNLADFVRDDKGTCLWYVPSLVIDRDKDRNIRGHAIRPKKVNMPIPRKVKKQAEQGFIINVLYRACEITESRITATLETFKKQAEAEQATAEDKAEIAILQAIHEEYHAKVTAEMLRLSEQVTEQGEKLTELFAHWLTGEKLPVNMASVYETLAGNDGVLSCMDKFNIEGLTAGSAVYDDDTKVLIQEFRDAIKRKLAPYTAGNDVHYDIPLGVSSTDVLMFYKWSEAGTNGKTRNRRYAGKSGAERFAVDVMNWLVFKVCKVKMTEAEKAEDLQA